MYTELGRNNAGDCLGWQWQCRRVSQRQPWKMAYRSAFCRHKIILHSNFAWSVVHLVGYQRRRNCEVLLRLESLDFVRAPFGDGTPLVRLASDHQQEGSHNQNNFFRSQQLKSDDKSHTMGGLSSLLSSVRSHAFHGGFNRRRSKAKNSLQQPAALLLVGFLFGSVFSHMFWLPLDRIASSCGITSVHSIVVDEKHKWFVPAHSGWHPILVHYGSNEGQPNENGKITSNISAQWFSHSHQDEIVMDLLSSSSDGGGTNAPSLRVSSSSTDTDRYFVDLGVSASKDFSNTLALEHRGWNGT